MEVAWDAARFVVGRQGVFLAVQRELAVLDAVAEAADGGAEISGRRAIGLDCVEAQDDIGDLAPGRGDVHPQRGSTIIAQDQRGAMSVADCKGREFLAIEHTPVLPFRRHRPPRYYIMYSFLHYNCTIGNR